MERGKLNTSPNLPPALVPLLSQLETCHSHQDYAQILSQLELMAKSDTEISSAYSYALSQYPTLSNIEPATIAKSLREYYSLEDKKTVTSSVFSVSLDPESMQNIKKELLKTYQENNIGFLANECDIGLDDSVASIPPIKRKLPLDQSSEEHSPHIFTIPNGQKAVIGIREVNELSQRSPNEPSLLSGFNTPSKKEETPFVPPNLPEEAEEYQEESDEIPGKLKEFCGKESASSRSSRGLRVLSVRVRELVFEKRITTYKEVADDLIRELVEEGKMSHDAHSSKDEKNVRRRVYDALNVLIAAGIIKRNGKNVQYDPKVRYQVAKSGKNQTEASKELEKLRGEIQRIKEESDKKKRQIKDLKIKKQSIKGLIKRNEQLKKQYGSDYLAQEVIKFPFIVLSTENSSENGIAIRLSEDQKQIQVGFKKPFGLLGDIDTLVKLQMHKQYSSKDNPQIQ